MTDIQWPWQYSFPPFFTLQPHMETRARQISAWRLLILDYYKSTKQSVLDIREASSTPLFHNATIGRKLETDVILTILLDLEKTANAAPCDKTKQRWEIYWHTLEEWASILHRWAMNNGMNNSVCTLFELTQGDNTVNEEFYGLSKEILLKALRVLENDKKCEVIIFDDNEGVKFF